MAWFSAEYEYTILVEDEIAFARIAAIRLSHSNQIVLFHVMVIHLLCSRVPEASGSPGESTRVTHTGSFSLLQLN